MPYLNLDPNYPEHPKTRRLVAILGEMADALPIRLWAYNCRFHPKDGRMRGYTDEEMEGVVLGWRGTPGKALAAMVSVKFVSKARDGFVCVDWTQHQGHLAAFSRRGRTAAKARWARYASSMHKACLDDAPALPSLPNHPNHPNQPEQPGLYTNRVVDKSVDNSLDGKGNSQDRARDEDGKAGICDFKYPNGPRCDSPREKRSPFCRKHIEHFRDRKTRRVEELKSGKDILEDMHGIVDGR